MAQAATLSLRSSASAVARSTGVSPASNSWRSAVSGWRSFVLSYAFATERAAPKRPSFVRFISSSGRVEVNPRAVSYQFRRAGEVPDVFTIIPEGAGR